MADRIPSTVVYIPAQIQVTFEEQSLRGALDEIKQAYPNLASYGWHVGDHEKSEGFRTGRDEMDRTSFLLEIAHCMAWIRHRMRFVMHINRRMPSMQHQHEVWRETGNYVSNGAFIIAAMLSGARWKRRSPKSGSSLFNLLPTAGYGSGAPHACHVAGELRVELRDRDAVREAA